jgi:hypothetical protein
MSELHLQILNIRKSKTNRYRVTVTQEDIDKADENKENFAYTSGCPVGRACQQKFKLFKLNSVDVIVTRIRLDNYYYNLPKKVRDFIVDYDTMKLVKPFSFILDLNLSNVVQSLW